MTALYMLLLLSEIAIQTKISGSKNARNCLLQQKFYHPESSECYYPLQYDGPCPLGQWLIPATTLGNAECVPAIDDLPDFCSPVLLDRRKVVCREDQEKFLYKTEGCNNGQILLPSNFRENTRPCPRHWSCQNSTLQFKELCMRKNVGS